MFHKVCYTRRGLVSCIDPFMAPVITSAALDWVFSVILKKSKWLGSS